MFNMNEYLNELVVAQDDEELLSCLEGIKMYEMICDDAWLARAHHFGVAGAMERQLEYIAGTLLVNAQEKLSRMKSNGIIGESYTMDSWFGTTNEDDPHVNEEVSFDQQVDDQETFIDNLESRIRTGAILFVTHVRAHDEISKDLNQPSYGGIKAKAAANRAAKEAKAA